MHLAYYQPRPASSVASVCVFYYISDYAYNSYPAFFATKKTSLPLLFFITSYFVYKLDSMILLVCSDIWRQVSYKGGGLTYIC